MNALERGSQNPEEVLLATGVSSEQTENIATYLAGHELIQVIATPSISEWRARRFAGAFLNELPQPTQSVKILMSYARVLHGVESQFDLLLRTILLPGGSPNYPDREVYHTLVLLKHGEAKPEELLGK